MGHVSGSHVPLMYGPNKDPSSCMALMCAMQLLEPWRRGAWREPRESLESWLLAGVARGCSSWCLASTDPSSDMVLLIYGPQQRRTCRCLYGAGRQVVLLIFVSGKIVLTGAKEKQARTHPAPPPRRSGCLCIPAPALVCVARPAAVAQRLSMRGARRGARLRGAMARPRHRGGMQPQEHARRRPLPGIVS